MHTAVPRSTFGSQNAKKSHDRSTFVNYDVEKCMRLWREAHLEVKKVLNTDGLGPLLHVEMSKKRTVLWREACLEVKM